MIYNKIHYPDYCISQSAKEKTAWPDKEAVADGIDRHFPDQPITL